MLDRLGIRTGQAGMAAMLVMATAGCGDRSRGISSDQISLNAVMGERLGARMVEEIEAGREVVLVHMSSTAGEADQWIKGLKRVFRGRNDLVVLGRDQLPVEAAGAMGGFPALSYALQQHPNAAAVVTTLPVGAFERPRFPEDSPPIYALGWSYLPDSIHLFRKKHLVAGVFERPDPTPRQDGDGALSPDERFDRHFVMVTAENLREEVQRY